MYEKLLVPLDGSELAEVALPYAEELAGRLGSEVTLIHVRAPAEDSYQPMHQAYLQKMVEVTKQGAERFIRKSNKKLIKVDSSMQVGHPAEEIVDYANKEDVALIVMATHGRSGIRRWALGSVADKVVRATKQPLLLIRAKGAHTDVRERGVLHKVFVPLDGSRESEAIIPYVEELAARFKAKVILFRVVVPNYYFEYTEEEIIQLQPSIASTKDYLDKVSARLKHRGLTVKPEISIAAMVGAAAEQDNKIAVEIIKFAEELNTDVVAMSTYGQSGISRWAFGSITDKVLHAGTTPLLLVRIPGARKE